MVAPALPFVLIEHLHPVAALLFPEVAIDFGLQHRGLDRNPAFAAQPLVDFDAADSDAGDSSNDKEEEEEFHAAILLDGA